MTQKTKSKLKQLFEEEPVKEKKTKPTKPIFTNTTNSTVKNNNEIFNSDFNTLGLNNFGNTCYSNVVMQAIISNSDFFKLLEAFYINYIEKLEEKIIDSEYTGLKNLYYAIYYYIQKNSALSAKYLLVLSTLFDPFGKQNDAHEYLVFLLDKCHEEMIKAEKDIIIEKINKIDISSKSVEKEEDNWEEVNKDGKRMKLTNTENDFPCSLIREFFGGLLKHETNQTGISVNNSKVEPFYVLSIDSKDPLFENSVKHYFAKKIIEDKIGLYQKSYFEKLPNTLIIQVKSFYYDKLKKQVCKDNRKITYFENLKIQENWLSPSQRINSNLVNYELFSIIVHQGKKTSEGHYVCFTKNNKAQNIWTYISDKRLISVSLEDVLNHRPYLMFYKKCS